MAHKEQILFINKIQQKYPQYFRNVSVIDFGSLDINGNNKSFFTGSDYTGVDIIKGNNVDVISPCHQYNGIADVVISTEMLEHDKDWEKSLENMVRCCKNLLIITCATTGRKEHGTKKKEPFASPATLDYYKNITHEMFWSVIKRDTFRTYRFEQWLKRGDLYFYGLK